MRRMSFARFSSYGAVFVLAASNGACSSDSPAAAGAAGRGGTPAGSAGATTGGAPTSAGTSSGGAGQAGMSGASSRSGGSATTGGVGGVGGATGGSSGSAGSSSGSAGQAGAGGDTEVPGPLRLTSPAFNDGGLIDVKFRCTGANASPVLDWTRGPQGTLSFAVTLLHVGSQSVHWVLWDIPATARTLPESIAREATPVTPAGTKQIKPNIDGAAWYGYTGPCPGSANQSYTFSVYALDVATLPGVTPDSTSTAANTAVKAHQLAVASLTVMASK